MDKIKKVFVVESVSCGKTKMCQYVLVEVVPPDEYENRKLSLQMKIGSCPSR